MGWEILWRPLVQNNSFVSSHPNFHAYHEKFVMVALIENCLDTLYWNHANRLLLSRQPSFGLPEQHMAQQES